MIEMVIEAGSLAATTKRTKPSWPILTSILVSIYRDEQAKLNRIESLNTSGPAPTSPVSNKRDKDFD